VLTIADRRWKYYADGLSLILDVGYRALQEQEDRLEDPGVDSMQ